MSSSTWRAVGIATHLVVFSALAWATIRLIDVLGGRDEPGADPHGYVLLIVPPFLSIVVVLLAAGLVSLGIWLRAGRIAPLAVVDLVTLAGALLVVGNEIDLLSYVPGVSGRPSPLPLLVSLAFLGAVLLSLLSLRRGAASQVRDPQP